MDVKQAVTTAFQYVRDLFANEKLTNLGLEEVEFDQDEKEWRVTVGFSRPWDFPQQSPLQPSFLAPDPQPRRDYKVVRVKEDTGEVTSVRNRDVSYAGSGA